ncbi:MAG: hypothetical protein SGILL_007465, partial [Bacillariaceae sp.]
KVAAGAAASRGTDKGALKRGRPPKVISIKQNQQQEQGQVKRPKTSSETHGKAKQTNASTAGAVERSAMLPSLSSSAAALSRAQGPGAHPGRTGATRNTFSNINWDSLMAGQFRQLSSDDRFELWRQMLENRPSPTSSPSSHSNASASVEAAHSSSGAASDPRELREWLDRILWMSDPQNWSQHQAAGDRNAAAPADSRESEGSAAAHETGTVHAVLEEEADSGAVEEKRGDDGGLSNRSQERNGERAETFPQKQRDSGDEQ